MGSCAPTPAASGADATDGGDSTILVVESFDRVGSQLVEQLRADAYLATRALNAEHARSLARSRQLRAVLLGALDTETGAFELLAEIRGADPDGGPWDPDLPVLVLGSRTDELALLRAFEAGADDFIARAAGYLELRARLRAILRRVERPRATRLLRVGPVSIDTASHSVRVAGTPVELRRLEYELLVHLAHRPTHAFSKRELLNGVWGYGSQAGARTVDSHASRLRRKLCAAGAPGLVVNVWGVGYRLV